MLTLIGMTLATDNFEIDRPFRIAMGDMLVNVVYYRSGLLDEPVPCLVAGLSSRTRGRRTRRSIHRAEPDC